MGSFSVFPPAQLGAAALLFIAIVFWGRTAKARRLVQRALDLDEADPSRSNLKEADPSSSNLDEAGPSHSGADVRVQDIFLSHSGKQKPFVERLYDALQSANHTAFFDQHCLPKALPFPSRIKQAASGCKIGVVVLSEDFLTSKWPMLELEMLVFERGPNPCVLPLFYKLQPADLRSPKNLARWRREWKKMAAENAERWERAVKTLRSLNGEVFTEGTSEGAYIKKVVRWIGTLVPCHAPYDLSSIEGHPRLAEEVAAEFGHLDARQACMVGLHGVGGVGKTTLCKIMVNYYSSEYLGRSFLIEFPSTGGDKLTIWQECKKALKKLTNLSDEHLLNEAASFDQVVHLMKERVRQHDAFLAIDNVWESSLEEAERLLGVGFSAKSKILLMSRSEQVLKDLLKDRGHAAPLPTPEREEAFQIFQKALKSGDLNSLVDREQMDRVLERCRFSGKYHALALKALAQYVKSVCMLGGLDKIEHHLRQILEEISNADLQSLEDVIRLSYENLPEHKKHMFLDVAVWLKELGGSGTLHASEAHEWMSCLYKKFSKTKTSRLIHELALDGLIQIEEDEWGVKVVRMHDLFLDLAWREAASSSRFLTKKSVEKIEWERLERVILRDDKIDMRQLQKCRKLQFLWAKDIEIRSGIQLDCMPSLSVLMLEGVCFVDHENGSATTGSGSDNDNVEVSHPRCAPQPLEHVPGMPSLLVELPIANPRAGLMTVGGPDASSVLNLNGSVELFQLKVQSCSFVEVIAGLEALRNLCKLRVCNCVCLKNLDGLSGLIRLEVLDVEGCASLEKMPDLRGLTCLKRLRLRENIVMGEVGCEYLSSTLTDLDVAKYGSLRSLPSLEKCMHCMKILCISATYMKSLQPKKLPTNLRILNLSDDEDEDGWVFSEDQLLPTKLETLRFLQCGSIKRWKWGVSLT